MDIKKTIFLALLITILPIFISASIVNNSGSTAADSTTFEFFLLDSSGQAMLQLLVGDTVWLHVYYPSGALAYRDSVVGTAAGITEQGNSDFYSYTWKRAVADIDGAGKDGVYRWVLNAKDVSLGLPNPFHGSFQLYQTSDYDSWADRLSDSLQGVIDSLQSQDGWVAQATELTKVIDTVNGIIDTLQNQDDWVAKQTSLLAAIDSINGIIDSIQNQSTWVGHQTTLDTILDTIPPNFNVLAILSTGEVGIDLGNTQGTLDAAEIGADAITAAKVAADVHAEGADAIWDEDTTGHNTANSYGVTLLDTTVYQGSASGLTAEGVWNVQFSTVFTAGSMGDSLNNSSYVQGSASGLTASEIADTLDARGLFDSLFAVLDTVQNQSTWIATASALTNAIDSINAIIDSVQSHSTWGAKESSLFDGNLDIDNATGDWSAAQFAANCFVFGNFSGTGAFWNEGKTGYGLTVAERGAIEDSVYANRADYKSDVSALALEASLFDPAADSVNTLHNNKKVQADITADSVLEDSSSYQGSASGLTAAEISDSVWQELQSAHTTAGTFGKYLDTEVSGVSGASGNGAFTYNWVLIDSTSGVDTVLPGALVWVNNEPQTATPLWAITSNLGVGVFSLDAADWVVFTTYPGMVAVVDSFTVTGTATDTLYVYRDSTNVTTVVFDLNKITGGDLAYAKIRIKLESENDSLLSIGNTVLFNPYIPDITANASGIANVSLYANPNITNDSTWYRIHIYDKRWNNKGSFDARVPDTTVIYVQDLTMWNVKVK